MRKALTFLLVFCMVAVSASAELTIKKETETAIRFNASAKTFGAPVVDEKTMIQTGNTITFPMNGYDIIFMFDENNAVDIAGVRLYSETAAGDFLTSCMAMVTMFATVDFTAFGMILHQYGQLKSGAATSTPYSVKGDEYMMTPGNEDYLYLFAYANVIKTW